MRSYAIAVENFLPYGTETDKGVSKRSPVITGFISDTFHEMYPVFNIEFNSANVVPVP